MKKRRDALHLPVVTHLNKLDGSREFSFLVYPSISHIFHQKGQVGVELTRQLGGQVVQEVPHTLIHWPSQSSLCRGGSFYPEPSFV